MIQQKQQFAQQLVGERPNLHFFTIDATSNLNFDLDHAKQFVREQGFQMEEFSALEVLDQLECLSALGIERDIAKKLLTTIPIFVLRLA